MFTITIMRVVLKRSLSLLLRFVREILQNKVNYKKAREKPRTTKRRVGDNIATLLTVPRLCSAED